MDADTAVYVQCGCRQEIGTADEDLEIALLVFCSAECHSRERVEDFGIAEELPALEEEDAADPDF